jgi:hypothetical protein
MPIAVTIMTLFCIAVHLVSVVPRISVAWAVISTILVLFFGALFLVTFFMASCMDPGFLPFTWVLTRRFWYSWEDQLNGLAVTSEQIIWARDPAHRPPGASFSAASGRFVLRADHICGWIGNWVGKRNHKQFILFNFYGFWLALTLVAFKFAERNPKLFDLPSGHKWAQLVAAGLEGLLGLSMLGVFGQNLADLANNRTKIQRMRNDRGLPGYTCEQSMREICGEGSRAKWIWPAPAFDRALVVGEGEELVR